jgi:uncharacterized repeat protein (TIGR01451 family)
MSLCTRSLAGLLVGLSLVSCSSTTNQSSSIDPHANHDYDVVENSGELDPHANHIAGNQPAAQAMASEPAPQPKTQPKAESKPKPTKKKTVKAAAPAGMLLSELMLPTGDRDSSVLLIEKYGPATVNVNQPYDYKLVVTNLTDGELGGVMINDAFPQGFDISKTSPEFPASDVRSGKWVIGNMDGNEVREVTITGSATTPGQISSCTQATYDRSMCLVTNVVQPGLQLDLTAPAEVLICDDILVSYRLCNPGTGDATNVKVTAPYPAGLVDKQGNKSLNKSFAKLTPGQCEEFSVVLNAEKKGNFAHNGEAKGDASLSANARSMSTLVRQPELRIECAKGRDVFVGRQGAGVFTVTNVGDAVSADTVLRARLSDEFGFVRASDGGTSTENAPDLVTWNLGNIAPGQSREVNITLRTMDIGTGTITARAEGVCAPEVACSTDLKIKGIPAVLLEVIDENDPVVVGDNEVYTITATNQGSAADKNIRIVATLPDNVQFVSATGATRGTAQGNRVVFDALASLSADKEAVWKIVVKSARAANARFRVTMHTDNLGSTPVEETEATNYYE